jgi:hypothetical protein
MSKKEQNQYFKCFSKIRPGDSVIIWLNAFGCYSNEEHHLSEPIPITGYYEDFTPTVLLETDYRYGFPAWEDSKKGGRGQNTPPT